MSISIEELNAIPRPRYFMLGEWSLHPPFSSYFASAKYLDDPLLDKNHPSAGSIAIGRDGRVSTQLLGIQIHHDELRNLLSYFDAIAAAWKT